MPTQLEDVDYLDSEAYQMWLEDHDRICAEEATRVEAAEADFFEDAQRVEMELSRERPTRMTGRFDRRDPRLARKDPWKK